MKVFSNLAISLDGKICDLRTPGKLLGTDYDRKMMQTLRARCDVVVFGAQTLRVHPLPMALRKPKRGQRQPANAVLTVSGDLPREGAFWEAKNVLRFVFTTKAGLAQAMACARDRAFVIVASKTGRDGREVVCPEKVLKRLGESNLNNVLVEGGGEVMAAFLEDHLLHELNVTLTPWLLGGRNNPTLVGGQGLEKWVALKPKVIKRVKDELYMRYDVKGARHV